MPLKFVAATGALYVYHEQLFQMKVNLGHMQQEDDRDRDLLLRLYLPTAKVGALGFSISALSVRLAL